MDKLRNGFKLALDWLGTVLGLVGTGFGVRSHFDSRQRAASSVLGHRPQSCLQRARPQAQMAAPCQTTDLVGTVVFEIGCFAGPKGGGCLALSSKLLLSLSPIDGQGLTEHYIEGLPCPGPLAAGIIGISSHEFITLRPDAAGTVRSGVITHIVDGLFALRSEESAQEFIEWRSIGEVNGEVMPINMQVFDPELVFLMMRLQTPEYIMERMLYFSVRTRKTHLIREIIRRLGPSPQVLGHVLLMVSFHESVLESVCEDLKSGCKDCCLILVDNGAAISREVAVKVRYAILSRKYVYYQRWGARRAEIFRQWQIATSTAHCKRRPDNLSNLLDDWFPLQLAHDGDDYIGPDDESITYDDGRWIFTEFDVIDDGVEDGRQFYSSAPLGDRMPTQGDWIRFPDADYEEGERFVVNNVDTLSWFDAFSSEKQTLLSVSYTHLTLPTKRIV